MSKRLTSLSLLLVTTGFAWSLQARVAIGAMAGTVLDAQGKPVAGATVTMQTSDGGDAYATHTDASGKFQFARYRIGQYDLRAYSNGAFSGWVKRIAIHSGKTTRITLRMPPAADESATVSR